MGVGAGLSMYVVVVQKFTFAISSPDEFLYKRSPKNWRLYHASPAVTAYSNFLYVVSFIVNI